MSAVATPPAQPVKPTVTAPAPIDPKHHETVLEANARLEKALNEKHVSESKIREAEAILNENKKLIEELAKLKAQAVAGMAPTVVPIKGVSKATIGKGQMRTYSLRLRMSKDDDVPKTDITASEAIVLIVEHINQVGQVPIHEVVETKPVDRSTGQEMSRLRGKYGQKRIDYLFHGALPNLPETLEDAVEAAASMRPPESGFGASLKLDEIKM